MAYPVTQYSIASLVGLLKTYLILIWAFSGTQEVIAQPQFVYNPATSSTGNTIPFNSNTSNRRQWVYYASDFQGVHPGLITKIYIRPSTSLQPNFTSVTILMGTTALNTFTSGPYITSGMDTVLHQALYGPVYNASGPWMEFLLDTPFPYDGTSNFIIDARQTGYSTGFSTLQITSGVSQRSLYGNLTTPSGTQDRLAIFGFDMSPMATCTIPPGPGISKASLTSLVCMDTTVLLELEGHTTGWGQTYTWQSAPTLAGPYTDISLPLTDPLYLISPTATAFYRCAVTCDTSTSHSTPVEITVVPLPVVSLGTDTFYCEGSSFSMTLDAANPGGTFMWNTGATTQTILVDTAGTYMVSVTAPNTCQESAHITVLEHPKPIVNIGNDTTVCQGTPTFFILNAANPGSTYQWSSGSQGSSTIVTIPGTYSVTVTSNLGCPATDTITIIEVPRPSVSINDTIACEGETIILDAGNSGSAYLWSNQATTQTLQVTTSGQYEVTVTNSHNCSSNDVALVTIHPLPVVDLGSDTAVYLGAVVTLNAGNQGATYLWSTGATTQSIEVTTHGSYSVTVTDANGCEGTDGITIIGTGITTLSGLGTATLFPNPASQSLHVRIELLRGDSFHIEVFDATGRMVSNDIQELSPGTHTLSLQVNALAQGTYMVRIRTVDGLLGTLPFVKQ